MASPNFSPNNTKNNADPFIVEDLFDFPNDDAVITDATFDSVPGNSTDSSTVTAVDSCNSSSFSGSDPNPVADIGSRNLSDGHFSGDLCVPYDDIAELEWLSNFVEESFSSEDLQQLQLISGMKGPNDDVSEARGFHSEPTRNSPIFDSEVSVPAKARSKRSRGPPCNWTSRLLVVSPTTSSTEPDVFVPATATPPGPVPSKKPAKAAPRKKDSGDGSGGDGRRCLHCATDKTPQWRTGPMGPKTLCNACGVRYKSGRLVPEYRPAASPTFVLTKHSNSHRKVLELRRQKEMVRAQQHQQQQFLQQHHHHHQNMMFDVSNGDDYLIHQHVGPDFRQLI
ncbi:GATA transcription factor 12 [Spatholobus suberectus]|nr:GATA transcription factor 12 [Spatholobus suberectus]